ncbi:hypothetical protein HPB48_022669 [Haemaphysalis longicornis]|uniref:Uncharacterized protein n=1 Tax=Haemaphysalis longicornis TaxID=44386 RepID=A0A9J6G099_HAELO|nr:hypothetical protein HPB48_022669 [Haemaphysalis longicornis]
MFDPCEVFGPRAQISGDLATKENHAGTRLTPLGLASTPTPSGGMEVVVAGEDISPDELQKDGWKDIHHAHRENAAAKKIAEAPNPTFSADHAPKQHRPRPKRRIPPPEKLPEEDFKIVFRPHDGLNVRTSQADILDAAYKSAGISYVQGEQLRTNVTSNYFMLKPFLRRDAV